MSDTNPWFKTKSYLHIGPKIKKNEEKYVSAYVRNISKIESHSFLPLIHCSITERRFRSCPNKKKRIADSKTRDIFYASHLDAAVLSYYAFKLSNTYEESLSLDLKECITAYRKIKKIGHEKGNKCNINFAQDVFDFIKDHPNRNLGVLALDISGFFDNLDHSMIKRSWCKLLNKNSLPRDHYKIYRYLTHYSYIELNDLFEEFKSEIIVKKQNSIQQKEFNRFSHLRKSDAIAFCYPKQIKRIKERGLLKLGGNHKNLSNKKKVGIPQGLPISSFLANLYMYEFDKAMQIRLSECGGLYRRYSDDIIFVCPDSLLHSIEDFAKNKIKELKLLVNERKTQRYLFNRSKQRGCCYEISNDLLLRSSKLTYLGLEFDGNHTFIKSGSISSYWRKYKQSLQRSVFFARHTGNKKTRGKVFKSRILKRFTHLGAKRKMKYTRDLIDKKKWNKTTYYNWGNYLSYIYKASYELNNKNFRKQLRRHWLKIQEDLKDYK